MDNLIGKYGKGASLMLRMGYVPGRGLGLRNQGIVEPIMPVVREKGQGIKVNKMKSRVVDDWSDSEEDQMQERKPLGFSKTGEDVPDFWTLIHELQAMKIAFPKEVLETKNESQEVRRHLWTLLKEGQSRKFMSDYLSVEITNLDKSVTNLEYEYAILQQAVGVSETSEIDQVLEWASTVDPLLLSEDARQDILDLCVSMLAEPWTKAVEKCDFNSLEAFTQLIEVAERYKSLLCELSSSSAVSTQDLGMGGIASIYLSAVEATLFSPLFNKLRRFYNSWDPTNSNMGIGVFEELAVDRSLFPHTLIQRVVVEDLIVPKLNLYLKGNEKPDVLVEWFSVIQDLRTTTRLLDSIFEWYIKHLRDGSQEYSVLDQWLDLFPRKKPEFIRRIFVELMVNAVKDYRKGDPFDSANAKTLFAKCQKLMETPTFRDYPNRQAVCMGIVENEFTIGMVQELKHVPVQDQKEFWDYWTQVLSEHALLQMGVLEDIEYGKRVIEGYKVVEYTKLQQANIRGVLNGICARDKPVEEEKKISIKDKTIAECEQRGVSIVPDRTLSFGVQTFKIGTNVWVYFKDGVVWASTNGATFKSMDLAEIFRNVV